MRGAELGDLFVTNKSIISNNSKTLLCCPFLKIEVQSLWDETAWDQYLTVFWNLNKNFMKWLQTANINYVIYVPWKFLSQIGIYYAFESKEVKFIPKALYGDDFPPPGDIW